MIVIGKIVQPDLGMRFPTLFKLAPALPLSNPLRIFYERFRENLARAVPSEDFEGPFCSAFVALVFNELGFPLFSDARNCDCISPNDLLFSNLEVVPHAITHADFSLVSPKLDDGSRVLMRLTRLNLSSSLVKP